MPELQLVNVKVNVPHGTFVTSLDLKFGGNLAPLGNAALQKKGTEEFKVSKR